MHSRTRELLIRKGKCISLQRRIRAQMHPYNDVTLPSKISISDDIEFSHDVRFERAGDGIHVVLARRSFEGPSWMIRYYIPAFYFWFSRCQADVRQILVNCSDGEALSAGQFANSTCRADVVPLPDAHFFKSKGYAHVDARSPDAAENWNRRSDDIVWRGYPTGIGYFNTDDALSEHPGTVQRIRMARKAQGSEVDFRFVHHPHRPAWNAAMTRAGLMADRVPEGSWAGRKYAIDIDGFTNAWSNFIIRLKLGCCVLKVGSVFGFRQWYYDQLTPYQHYVPVKADLSDLFEQIDWVRSHQREARDIAIAGQALARKLTFESETAEAARLITENWAR